MNDPVLEVEGLSKRFGNFWAVKDLSFKVGPGEVVGFLGQNGSGKSTTIKMLCNLVRPTEGDIRLNGESILDRSTAKHRKHLGAMVEAPRFYPHLSGYRNLELLARIHRVDRHRVQTLLEQVDLSDRAHERFGRFSMGMKQRLGLAAVLLNNPSLIILDEPTTGLDLVGQAQIHDLIRKLVQHHGASVFLSSHQLEEVAALCSRAIIIHEGSVLQDRPCEGDEDLQAIRDIFSQLAASDDSHRRAGS